MMKNRVLKFAMAAIMLTPATGLSGQGARTYIKRDFGYVQRQDGWLTSPNAAGLLRTPADVSYIEAYYDKTNGGLRNYYESSDCYDFGLKTESYRCFGKIGFYGMMQYEYFDGKEMSGSILMRPDDYPFDILEFTPGRKHGEKYVFSGGAGFRLTKSLTGGVRANYETADYAKRKDLRHKNTLMDFDLSGGLRYAMGALDIGANYTYRKQTEKVEGKEIGTNSDGYFAFFDRGLWYGPTTLWSGSQIHLTETGVGGFPLKYIDNGGALQINYSAGRFSIFNELTYAFSQGEAGEKGVIWTMSETGKYAYRGTAKISGGNMTHLIRLNASFDDMDSYENILTTEMINNTSHVRIIGKLLTLQERRLKLGGEYEINFGAQDYDPDLSVRLGADFFAKSGVGALMYPEYRKQDIRTMKIGVSADKLIRLGKRHDIKAAFGVYGYFGDGNKMLGGDDTSGQTWQVDYDKESTRPGRYPSLFTEYLDYEFEYLTAQRYGLTAGLRYTYLAGRSGFPVYLDLSFRYANAAKVEYLKGNTRYRGTVTIGCVF